MSLKQNYLNQTQFRSFLKEQSHLSSTQKPVVKSLNAHLILTSLVDAFSILVIYLLMTTTSAPHNLKMDLELPLAQHTQVIKPATVVKINHNGYYINDKKISVKRLTQKLSEIQKELPKNNNTELVVQAQKRLYFSHVNPILLAGSASGFNKFKFTVVQKGANP